MDVFIVLDSAVELITCTGLRHEKTYKLSVFEYISDDHISREYLCTLPGTIDTSIILLFYLSLKAHINTA